MKALNQIDFAIAVFIMFTVVSFSMAYISNYFSLQTPAVSDDMRNVIEYVKRVFFDSKGIPADWENRAVTPVRVGLQDSVSKMPIIMKDDSGKNKTDEEIDIFFVLDGQCKYNVYNNSLRLYDSFFNETNFTFYNTTYCSGNYLKETNIQFLLNLTGNDSTTYYLYYSNKTEPWKNYTLNLYNNSLVGYWKLDSVNATNYTLDATGNKNDGQLKNFPCDPATCNLTAGYRKGGLVFDGVDDYVNISNFSLGQEFSVSLWINQKSSHNWDYVMSLNLWKGWGFYLWNTEGQVSIGYIQNGVTECRFGGESIVISDFNYNEWNYFSYTRNSTGQYLYFNGVLYQNRSVCGDHFWSGPFMISSASEQFNGTIDEVRIYNRSLSADEIKALYNFTRPTYINSPDVEIISDDKITGMQSLSYTEVRDSLGLKNHFNITVCESSFGKHVPDNVNVIASKKSVISRNATGDFGTCMAEIKIW